MWCIISPNLDIGFVLIGRENRSILHLSLIPKDLRSYLYRSRLKTLRVPTYIETESVKHRPYSASIATP